MEKLTVKVLKDALANLDDSKEIELRYNSTINDNPINIEFIKEIKENGREYYRVLI